jgi:hypothetical protein
MLIILRLQSYSTSTHTNCLIQLLKSGWLRSFVSTEARILQRLLYLSSGYFKKFSKFPYQLQPLALRSTWRLTSAGGEFYSVTTCCQLPFSPLSIQASEPKHSSLLTSSNSLIIKEFSVSSAPEVGRIIDRSRRASIANLNFSRKTKNFRNISDFLLFIWAHGQPSLKGRQLHAMPSLRRQIIPGPW